jgi:hypothetical protein
MSVGSEFWDFELLSWYVPEGFLLELELKEPGVAKDRAGEGKSPTGTQQSGLSI